MKQDMEPDRIVIAGARQHNLKNVTVEIPKKKLVVFTGVSGSGKSSLAFDTLYAEGQRRYIESLSAYARQFLGQMDKPLYDSIRGLAPTISIEQKTASTNPRSTVGTVTELHDYLRVLWARVGRLSCFRCGRPVSQQSAQQIVQEVLELAEGTKFLVLAPLVAERKGEHREVLEQVRKSGFARVRVDGMVLPLDEEIRLDKKKKHSIDAVVDRLVAKSGIRQRLTDSIETALRHGQGVVVVAAEGQPEKVLLRRPVPVAGPRVPLDVLEDRPAREDVDRLEPAADPEHRQAPHLGRGPGLGLELVAVGLDVSRAVDRLAVARRVDVGAAREEEPVHRREGSGADAGVGGRVEDERRGAVARHAIRVEAVLALGHVRFRLA